MRVRSAVLSLTLVAGCASAPPASTPPRLTAAAAEVDPAPPGLRLPTTVRPVRYRAALTVDPAAPTFSGEVSIDVELAEATRVIWLHADELTIEAAALERAGARVALSSTAVRDMLALRAAAPVAAGPATLHLRYRGRARTNTKGGLGIFEDGGERYAVTHFEPIDARRVFPSFDEPGFKVPWQLSLRVPRRLDAFSNTAVARTDVDGKWKRVEFAETAPLPSYLIAFAVGPFEVVDAGRTAAGTPVRIVTPKGRAAAAAYARSVVDTLQTYLEEYTGIRYPYGKLDHLAYPGVGGAMEHVGLITYAETALLMPEAERSVRREETVAYIAAHELAHQWFGNLVTPAWWDDLWLNESFASWAESGAIERFAPEWGVKEARAWDRHWALEADRLASARKIHQPVTTVDDMHNAFDGITYAKGAAVLAMIERWMRPGGFQAAIRAHLEAHRGGTATYADFASALAAVGGESARAVLDSFVDQPGAPRLDVELRCAAGRAPALALAQSRFVELGTETPREGRWDVPVCVRWGAGGTTGRACTLLREATGELALDGASRCPDWVMPNDGGRGYYRAALRGDGLSRLAGHLDALDGPERIAVASDAQALVAAGELRVAGLLDLVTALAKRSDRASLTAAVTLIDQLDDAVRDSDRRAWQAWVSARLGPAARRLGVAPRRGEPRDDTRLRATVLRTAGVVGADLAVVAAARAQTLRWFDDRSAIDGELIDCILEIAAVHGDRALWERFVAAARATTSMDERSRLLRAVGRFRDPALVSASLALVLGDDVPPQEASRIVLRTAETRTSARLGYQYLRAHWDALAARLAPEDGAWLSWVGTATCDPALRSEVESFFADRSAKRPGGARAMAQALETMDACIVWDHVNGEALSGALRARPAAK